MASTCIHLHGTHTRMRVVSDDGHQVALDPSVLYDSFPRLKVGREAARTLHAFGLVANYTTEYLTVYTVFL